VIEVFFLHKWGKFLHKVDKFEKDYDSWIKLCGIHTTLILNA